MSNQRETNVTYETMELMQYRYDIKVLRLWDWCIWMVVRGDDAFT